VFIITPSIVEFNDKIILLIVVKAELSEIKKKKKRQMTIYCGKRKGKLFRMC